ncbi:hypothetical protein [Pseudoduganella sp. R-34]|uniref:hypothetical protein n=1 Tax=Pseudoduganella sp. R-34 TaxID=3404062 RepID=UPI003CF01A81
MRAMMLLLLAVWLVGAQAAPNANAEGDLTQQIYRKRFEVDSAEIARLRSENAKLAGPLAQDYRDYLKAFYAADIEARRQNIEAYRWQLRSATIVLWLIIAITMCGVAFSGIQLWHGLHFKRKGNTDVDLEISMEKLRLKSSVVGVTVLVLSGAFFLLFVEKIYRIEVLAAEPQPATSATQPAAR